MPVTKVNDKKWEVNGEEYESEEKANLAYKANLALKFGIKPEKKKAKKLKKEK